MIYVRDIETRSACDLKHEGLYKYATHPTTELLCVAYCLDTGPIKLWLPGDPVPDEVKAAAKDKKSWAVAHNAPFEMAIEEYLLSRRHGWPKIPVERNVCTMAAAHAMALPGSLEAVAKVCHLKYQKDMVGHRVMMRLTRPRKPLKHEDPNGIYWVEDPLQHRILQKYCKLDTAAGREIAYALPWLSDEEQTVWVLDQKINQRGLFIDEELTSAAENIIIEANTYITKELIKLTNGQVTTVGQRDRILNWLKQYYPDLPDLTAPTVTALLEAENLPDHVERLLELRQMGAMAAPKKVKALINRREDNGRVRGAFVYHAAGTGRWSSRGAQLHNLKRLGMEANEIEAALKVIRSGSFKQASKHYDQPLAVIGDLIRAMVAAPKGHVLMGADFSGIEARVTAWLAGETSKLLAFEAYDRGEGPDPYIIAAADIFGVDPFELARLFKAGDVKAREQRQLGKAGVLAFGFGGGINAYKRFLPPSITMTDDELEKIKNAWRAKHKKVCGLWRGLKDATWNVIKRGHAQNIGKYLSMYNDVDSNMIGLVLPSGRHLAYPDMRIIRGFKTETGQIIETPFVTRKIYDDNNNVVREEKVPAREMIVMKDNSGGRWRDVSWWYGITMENAVQAIARDLLAEAMVRIDKAGFSIVGHVHDECIIEVKACDVEKIKPKFEKLMVTLPNWAAGLPVVANAWVNDRYSTTK